MLHGITLLLASGVANPITTAKHPCNCAHSSCLDLPLHREFDRTEGTTPAISGVTHKFASDRPVLTAERKMGPKANRMRSMTSLRDIKADWRKWTTGERLAAISFALLTTGMVPALLFMVRG
jgi:hypothetical protein